MLPLSRWIVLPIRLYVIMLGQFFRSSQGRVRIYTTQSAADWVWVNDPPAADFDGPGCFNPGDRTLVFTSRQNLAVPLSQLAIQPVSQISDKNQRWVIRLARDEDPGGAARLGNVLDRYRGSGGGAVGGRVDHSQQTPAVNAGLKATCSSPCCCAGVRPRLLAKRIGSRAIVINPPLRRNKVTIRQ